MKIPTLCVSAALAPMLAAALTAACPGPASIGIRPQLSTGVEAAAGSAGVISAPLEALHRPLDELLDLHVRDGFVYYNALRAERSQLDRYIASLDVPQANYQRWSPDQQLAFWLNAYNVLVLRTVVTHYPIRGRSAEYPSNSIRQIPGAFDRLSHRAAGRTVTLDEIEKTILPEFRDPRAYLALGRGAIGSGRLRSEAYTGARLDDQLSQVAAEFVRRHEMLRIDHAGARITVTPILGWHEEAFVAAHADHAPPAFATRSPIERAVVVLILPNLFPAERQFVERNQFTLEYHDFDWRLNDMAGPR